MNTVEIVLRSDYRIELVSLVSDIYEVKNLNTKCVLVFPKDIHESC
jgi:hypothetical protein